MPRCSIAVLAAAAIFANAGLALAGVTPPAAPLAAATPANFLDVRQFRILDARVPGTSIRQSVTVWQINAGTWSGQTLDGLSMALVEQTSYDGVRTTVCYVSELSTPAQREAVFTALTASQPALKDVGPVRIEPASIRVESDGQSVMIHLSLIS